MTVRAGPYPTSARLRSRQLARYDRITPLPTFSREQIQRRAILDGLINEYERAA
jgi:hypothetical protein